MTQWVVRVRCSPNTASSIAEALARRTDTSWISLTSGGAEIVCIVDARQDVEQTAPLLEKLPLSRGVLSIDAQCILHEFFGGKASLINKNSPLTDAQVKALTPVHDEGAAVPRPISKSDDPLLRALQRDGRTTVTSLATATGWSQTTVRRRIEELLRTHVLYFDVDFDQSLFDLKMHVVMWLQVPADHLDEVGQALAQHPEVGYTAATTGSSNIYSAVSCATAEALYQYLIERVAQLPSISQVETAPVMRAVKTTSGS
jgi:DNA-binding Lrp family transcriptional regulator